MLNQLVVLPCDTAAKETHCLQITPEAMILVFVFFRLLNHLKRCYVFWEHDYDLPLPHCRLSHLSASERLAQWCLWLPRYRWSLACRRTSHCEAGVLLSSDLKRSDIVTYSTFFFRWIDVIIYSKMVELDKKMGRIFPFFSCSSRGEITHRYFCCKDNFTNWTTWLHPENDPGAASNKAWFKKNPNNPNNYLQRGSEPHCVSSQRCVWAPGDRDTVRT